MRIEHVALFVLDLEKSRDFFVKYFSGKSNDIYHNEKTGFKSYFISFDDGARIELISKPSITDERKELLSTGFSHIALSVGSKESVDAITDRLRENGFLVKSNPRTTGDGYYESVILDYEGNEIEITV